MYDQVCRMAGALARPSISSVIAQTSASARSGDLSGALVAAAGDQSAQLVFQRREGAGMADTAGLVERRHRLGAGQLCRGWRGPA